MASRVIENALQSLRAEYEATPDLRLTSRQAAEILNVDWNTSVAVLQALEDSGFLRFSFDGRFARARRPHPPSC